MTARGARQGRIGLVVLLVGGLLQGCTAATLPSAPPTSSPAAPSLPTPTASPSPFAEATPAPSPISAATPGTALPDIAAAQLMTQTQGWVVTDKALLRTDDRGSSWTAITPAGLAGTDIKMVSFLDPMHGWVGSMLGADSTAPLIRVDRTTDGGRTWATAKVDLGGGAFVDGVGSIGLDFIDPHHGWLQVAVATNTGNSLGILFGTSDGGATWHSLQMPIGSPVRFVSPKDGWTAGGVGDRSFYVTSDGGATWANATVPIPSDRTGWTPVWRLPTFFDADHGVLPVTLESPVVDSDTSEGTFYVTSDRGRTWTLAGRTGPVVSGPTDIAVSSAILGPTSWLSGTADGHLLRTDDGGRTWRDLAPHGFEGLSLITLDFAMPDLGWAVAVSSNGGCWETSGFVCSGSGGLLMRTVDGGSSWTPVSVDSDASAAAAQAADAAAALATVEAWEKARQAGGIDAAWQLLSAYQRAAIGSRAAFAAAEQAYLTEDGGGAGYKIYPVGPISADDRDMIGSKILADVSAVADLSRAFVAHVMHPGAPGAALSSEGLLVAPLKDGGPWRIWIVQ